MGYAGRGWKQTARQLNISVWLRMALNSNMKKAHKKAKKGKSRARKEIMIPNILQLLTTAIREKRCVAIRYHDQRQVRVVEPHAIYTHESGELVMDAFQTRGYSSSGRPPPFWRPFRLKKISAITPLKEGFETRLQEGFSPDKDRYQKGLVARVDDQRKGGDMPPRVLMQSAARPNLYTQPQPEESGPQLPKNPFRR
jgi:predicted DNA-binding transcriptional regulator YafY